jgi:hypothetical protein
VAQKFDGSRVVSNFLEHYHQERNHQGKDSLLLFLYMANYQFCLSARVFDLLIPLPECAISLFYSFI